MPEIVNVSLSHFKTSNVIFSAERDYPLSPISWEQSSLMEGWQIYLYISTHCQPVLPFSPLSAAFPWRFEMQLWPVAGHSAYSRHYDNCSFPLAPWNDFQDCHHESIQWPQECFLARVERTHKSWQENETGHYQHLELIKRWFVGILGLVGGQK